ncbi:MAG: class I SAM-dependent methyltransferase [Chloroflexota bacterium]
MQVKSVGEQSYESFADRYAAHAPTKPHNAYLDRPAVLSLVPELTGLRVLDMGCGPGIYAEILLECGAAFVEGFDVTPAMLIHARQRLAAYPADRFNLRVHDLRAPLDFAADSSFDLALAPLVLDYIEDWTPVFRECHRVLRPGGVLVYSAGHPLADWEYSESGDYFTVERFQMAWGGFGEPQPVVTSYRRPLSDFLNPVMAAGLQLDRLLEARPTEEYRLVDAEGYARLMKSPSFLCVRASRPRNTSL